MSLLSFFWLCLSTQASAYTQQECIDCHRLGSDKSVRQIAVNQFKGSVHGKELACVDCHEGVVDESHTKIQGAGVVSCGACHAQERGHAPGVPEALRPRCASCHTRHDIRGKEDPGSSVSPGNLAATCAQCHPAQAGRRGVLSWLPSVQIKSHGKQDASVRFDRTDCVACHQGQAAHGEKTPLDRRNCRLCHAQKGGRGALLGRMHIHADLKKQPGVFAAALIYPFSVGILVLGGLRLLYRRVSRKGGGGK